MRESSKVIVRDVDGELEAIGESDPKDLFTDNMGFIIANWFKAVTANDAHTFTLNDTSNTSRTVTLYSGNTVGTWYGANNGVALGSQIQIGSSLVAPTRADPTLGTAFGTAPESAPFNTGTGLYTAGSGNISLSATIVSGGSGTINEDGLFLVWFSNSAGLPETFMIAHDVITPGVAFTPGKSITVQWSITD